MALTLAALRKAQKQGHETEETRKPSESLPGVGPFKFTSTCPRVIATDDHEPPGTGINFPLGSEASHSEIKARTSCPFFAGVESRGCPGICNTESGTIAARCYDIAVSTGRAEREPAAESYKEPCRQPGEKHHAR